MASVGQFNSQISNPLLGACLPAADSSKVESAKTAKSDDSLEACLDKPNIDLGTKGSPTQNTESITKILAAFKTGQSIKELFSQSGLSQHQLKKTLLQEWFHELKEKVEKDKKFRNFVFCKEFENRAANKKFMAPLADFLSSITDRDKSLTTKTVAEYNYSEFTHRQKNQIFLKFNYLRFQFVSQVSQLKEKGSESLTFARLRKAEQLFEDINETIDLLARFYTPFISDRAAKLSKLFNLSYDEVFADGNYAFMSAIDNFDGSKGFQFTTYLSQAMLNFCRRLSQNYSTHKSRFRNGILDQSSSFPDVATDEETAYSSLEINALLLAIEKLDSREQFIIRKRFGLDRVNGVYEGESTLQAVGDELGVSKERIRQLEKRSLNKLADIFENEAAERDSKALKKALINPVVRQALSISNEALTIVNVLRDREFLHLHELLNEIDPEQSRAEKILAALEILLEKELISRNDGDHISLMVHQ